MDMKKRYYSWVWILFCAAVLGFFASPVLSHAVEKDANSIGVLEKKMLSPSTRKIQYRKGRIWSEALSKWKKANKIDKTADHLTIGKKGWYTLCTTAKSGKRTLTQVYFYKKKYAIPMNCPLRVQEGYYYIVPREKRDSVVQVQNASVEAGGNVSIWTRGGCASQVWQLESAGGRKFRLKNVNSGLYLTCKKNGTDQAVQQKCQEKGKGQTFLMYEAGSGYTYIKCKGTKQFFHVNGNNLEFSARKNQKAWKYTWKKTEKTVSYAMVTEATYPTTLIVGKSFVLKGTVSSHYAVTTLTAGVYDKVGKAVLKKKIKPNKCIVDLGLIDAAITFGKLAAGNYTYKVVVRDTAGENIPVIDRKFTVGILPGGGSKILSYDSDLIVRIGHQSDGTVLEKKACASYALAYCNAILTGMATSPHCYWSSTTNVDCVWSKGGYTTRAYSTEQAVLQEAYVQLAAGKPSILHVTGNTAQHWLAIVGCRKTGQTTNLSASDFIAIDPWDGKVITVSDKYKVKTTYRLGVKS